MPAFGSAKQKFTGQILLALLFCYGVSHALNLPFAIAIPFTKVDISIGWLYYPFIVLVIVGASNAVNLTDGLDGLAAGCCVIAFIAYAIYSLWLGMPDVASFASVMAGCCAGFLFFNYHPAKIFMGDTGSLALGGHGDNGVYRVLCRPFPAPGLPFSPLCAGRGSAFPAVAFFTDIITIKKNRISCSHLTKTG